MTNSGQPLGFTALYQPNGPILDGYSVDFKENTERSLVFTHSIGRGALPNPIIPSLEYFARFSMNTLEFI